MSSCQACFPGKSSKPPKPVKSQDCPYLKVCEESLIKDEWELLCKDGNGPTDQTKQQASMIRQSGHHCWEMCKRYLQRKVDELEHRKPRDW